MAEINSNADRYPQWTKFWQQNLADIDAQLVNCCRNATGNVESTTQECCKRVQRWFENQPMDNATSTEFEELQANPNILRQQVADRLTQLSADGRVNLQITQQHGAQG